MVFKVNYRQQRSERSRLKQTKKDVISKLILEIIPLLHFTCHQVLAVSIGKPSNLIF